ncbi:hypothetical protein DTO169C6_8412 [Paecilomyces variotii]|nr:hypothetical protein DTO169C6_8412 [Paecilomyces variotii]KAJ9309871.1 hypothetical protein DTO217A2_509 [Paecilomyces variotii]KAJ9399572.1 hypothetical protein DTO282F9_3446 [Paecilomyces variotii]
MMPPRGPVKGSHLRQVSAASLDTLGTSRSVGTSHYDPAYSGDGGSIKQPPTGLNRRLCTIWVHDENFSREEVLFNQAAFSDTGVKVGDVIEISPVRGTTDASHSQLKPELGSRSLHESSADINQSSGFHPKGKFQSHTQGRYLFVVKPVPQDIKLRHSKLEISVTNNVANIFGFKNRSQVLLSVVDRSQCSAAHVDIAFRDQYLVRSDMWRLVMSELVDKTIYKGQKILFMGGIKATIKNIFIRGKKVLSGYFAPSTIPVFRSESAKYVLFIQMSREMWDFDAEGTGDILFSRVINGFLPELFKRWANIEARHLVTIVLFTRVEYDVTLDPGPPALNTETLRRISDPGRVPTRDFYRVVVNDMASGHWTTILNELKKDFRTFLRDVSVQTVDSADTPTTLDHNGVNSGEKPKKTIIAGRPSTSLRGNLLEAIHFASSHLAYDHIDRDMLHTATSIVVITPGTGVFEVSYESLASTTEVLTNYGISIDLVCLSPMPLHSVPLFKYRRPKERPTSSTMGETHSNYSSPELRHHGSSLMSRSSHVSPRTSAPGSFIRPMSRERNPENSKEWCFGIPHWVDISFWNPKTYREARRIAKNDPNAPIPHTVTKQSKTFVPRVRLYEIQMMGIMESEQSNISIPYLSEGHRGFDSMSQSFGSVTSVVGPHAAKFLFSPNSSYKAPLSDSLRPEPFLPNLANPRDMILPTSTKYQRKVLNWMDEYDDAVFHPSLEYRRSRKHQKSRKLIEPEVQIPRAHDRLSARSVTSLKEHEENALERSTSSHSSSQNLEKTGALSVRSKSPVATKDASPRKPAIKTSSAARPSRISRTISFALRGLGSAPPRAQASTEVNAEHARATPILNRKQSTGVLSDTMSVGRPSSSSGETASLSSATETPDKPVTMKKAIENSAVTPSRPISIKVASKKIPEEPDTERSVISNSFSTTTTEVPYGQGRQTETTGIFPMKRTGPKVDITLNAGPEDVSTSQSPSKALAPWVRSINPSNTTKDTLRKAGWFGRWQHAYPRPPHVALVKWKSLKSPAVLPLTTEEFPTSAELASDYLQTPYRVFPNDDVEGEEPPKSRDVLLREMISLRLSHGFQIIIGSAVAEACGQYELESLNVFDYRSLGKDGTTIYLSMGNTIHRLVCIAGGEIEVTRFTRRTSAAFLSDKGRCRMYRYAIRTYLSTKYDIRDVNLEPLKEEYNWNYADNYLAGHRDLLINPTQQLRFWRVRYVLIPMRLPAHSKRHMQSFNEDNEEEIHLLGINQLTHMWQRHKYVPQDEKRFQSGAHKKDQNPLNIMYQTRNPSEVVAAELDRILLTDPGLDNPPAQLLPDSELLERSSVNLSSLAQMIQGDKGVRMMDRRWHWRLHYNCFIGFEFTTWLLQNFRDIDTREEAVEFGNELMKHGLFQHVEKRHNFRDGNYFYQIASEYRVSKPESRTGWFPAPRKPDKSVPSTPVIENPKDSPSGGRARSESTDETATSTLNTPSKSKSKVAIMLSKSMKYDVDPRKRSNRPEFVHLHYDRLHNPENCFHIEIQWLKTTPKLIEDAVASWASTAEKFGLKLVQVPIAEACTIPQTQPFRKPYRIQLKVKPPKPPAPTIYNTTSFTQQGTPDKHYYQKALLKKLDYVLDFESWDSYPPDVEVSYSWGKPDFHYPQYIHRSGLSIIQITDEGDFLFLANRLYSTRAIFARDASRLDRSDRPDQYRPRAATFDPLDRVSPRPSPLFRPVPEGSSPASSYSSPCIESANLVRTPESFKDELEEFCNDAAKLERFYSESQVRTVSTRVGPVPTPTLDSSIPSLELPASVVGHHISPPATFGSRHPGESASSNNDTSGTGTQYREPNTSRTGSPRSGYLGPVL